MIETFARMARGLRRQLERQLKGGGLFGSEIKGKGF